MAKPPRPLEQKGSTPPAPTPQVQGEAVAPPKNLNLSAPWAFEFRRHVAGNFSGLWELTGVTPDGDRRRLIDADSLRNCLDTVGEVFEGEGL